MSEPVVEVRGVSQEFTLGRPRTLRDWVTGGNKTSSRFWALNDVSFDLEQGKSLALLGPNGSGKSTLLTIIAGILRPTRGTAITRGRLSALLQLGAGFHPDLTGRENVFLNGTILGMSRREVASKYEEIVDFSGIGPFMESPVKTYSSGMTVRLGFAVAAALDPRILLVDEVLAVGDEQFQNKCLARIRELQADGCSVILVTHTMGSAIAFTSEAILLNHGSVVASGETVAVTEEYFALMRGGRTYASEIHDDPSAPLHIADLSCTVEGVDSPSMVRGGAPLQVSVVLEPRRPVTTWLVRFHLWNSDGVLLFGTSTDRLGMDAGVLSKRTEIRMTIPDLQLNGGGYRLQIDVAETEQSTPWYSLNKAYEFSIPQSPIAIGPVDLRPDVEIYSA